jgi:UDP-N-acetylglucosamine transferase subunit ALG13
MYGFDRLIKEMDSIAQRTDEEIIMQIGESSYIPKNAKSFKFASKEVMDSLYERSRVVVCHAGTGSILCAMERCKPIIVVPRRVKHGEHVDDHQLDIAGELEKEDLITVVHDVSEIEKLLQNVSSASGKNIGGSKTLVKMLKEYINGL